MEIRDLRDRTRELLQGPLRHVKSAGLAAALIPLGAAPAMAVTTKPPVTSPNPTVTFNSGTGDFDYAFSVMNTTTQGSLFVTKFELPLFSASDIVSNSVIMPNGWSVSMTSNPSSVGWDYNSSEDFALLGNPSKYGSTPQQFNTPAEVLVFSTSGDGIGPGSSGSFGFSSQFGSTNAPGVAFLSNSTTAFVDPPIPNDPMTAPEPHTIIQAGIGGLVLVAAAGYRWMRSRLVAGVPS